MEKAKMVDEINCSTQRDRRNQAKVNVWGLIWVASWLGVNIGIKYEWMQASALIMVGVLITTLLGIGFIQVYRRFLREADELKRKIELEALAFSVGVGLVGGVSHSILVLAGIVHEWGFDVTVMLICLTYAVSVYLGHRRYS